MGEDFEKGNAKGFQGSAYVSFKTCDEADDFLKKYQLTGYCTDVTGLGGKVRNKLVMHLGEKEFILHAEDPAEPSDILWKN